MAKRLNTLTLEEGSRLMWQKELTRFFRESGDYTSYILPPAVILPDAFSGWIDIGDGIFHHTGRIIGVSGLWCLEIDDERLMGRSGLFVSSWKEKPCFAFSSIPIKIKAAAEYEMTEVSSRMIRQRPLKRGIGSAEGI